MSNMEGHNAAVKAISSQIEAFYNRKEAFRIYHGSTNSTRIVHFDREKMVDMSDFSHVLRVDKDRNVALVQPNVPMDALVEESLRYGLMPPVVMEFPGITTGGGFSGVAGESSSWKWGFFDRTVNWCDVVLPTGQIMRASPTENADLFHGVPGAYGTLCVTTLFELQLIPARKYVELEYVVVDSIPSAISAIQNAMTQAKWDYIDGIVFSANRCTIMLGHLTDNASSSSTKVKRFARPWDNWFYLHALSVTKATKPGTSPDQGHHTELIPLRDYLFRYDRGGFWTARYAFRHFHTPFDRLSRFLLDPLLHTRKMYTALNVSGLTQQYIIQDLALPFDGAEEFIRWVDAELGTYPLWLCPLRVGSGEAVPLHAKIGTAANKAIREESAASTPPDPSPVYLLNVGVWGPGPREQEPFVALNRALEAKVKGLGGFKWLYANAYYTEDEFWQIYDRQWYEGLRKKYQAETLPSVYEKVKAAEGRVKISGLRGVWTAVVGGKGGKHLLGK